jgi:hypothetical protein
MIHGSTFEGRVASPARRPACIAALRFLRLAHPRERQISIRIGEPLLVGWRAK